MVDALRYLIRVGGIEKQISYPYTGKDGKCKFSSLLVSETVSDLVQIERDEKKIKKALIEIGPLIVALDASSLHFYTKGSIIRQNSVCGQTEDDLNHGVVIVGFGVDEKGVEYWIVKNSWGTQFGDNGFFKIERNKNTCGISLDVSSSILK
jgi:C1A family cysteine protease